MKSIQVTKRWKRPYLEYMRSEAWFSLRKKFLQHLSSQKRFFCAECGAMNRPLQVHHKNYKHFKNEQFEDLELLCRRCHDKLHRKMNQQKKRAKPMYRMGEKAWASYEERKEKGFENLF